MNQTFTQNDLVRHLYTEESKQEAENLNYCLAVDEELSENFNDYRIITDQLTLSMMSPSADTINYIMEFSRITA